MLLLFIKFFAYKNTTEIEETEQNLGSQNKTEFRAPEQNETEIGVH